jgi:hypothetical protein
MDGACSTLGREANCIQILIIKYEGKKPLERSRCTWENNFKSGVKEIRYDGMKWINVAQDEV